MEFIRLSRLVPSAIGAIVPPFEEMRAKEPVSCDHSFKLVESSDNMRIVREAIAAGWAIMPVRRLPAPGGVGDNSFPQRVLFEMTSRCNTNCRMCPSNNMARARIHMDTGKYLSVVDELDARGIQGLWLFHIGESLLHPDFFQILEYVGGKKNLGVTWFSSNGILMTPETTRKLLNSRLGVMQISLLSMSCEGYATLAPDTPYDTIMNNLNSVIEMVRAHEGSRPLFRIQTVNQHTNRHELDAFIKKYYDKCDIISINMIEYQNLDFNAPSARPKSCREGKKCSRIANGFFLITSDGCVTICDEAFNNEYDIGNVWQEPIYDIWNGEKRRIFVQANESGEIWNYPLCSKCEDYDFG